MAMQRSVQIETVAELYETYDALDIPGYYEEGEENPYEGRCRVVPRFASVYVMIPETDTTKLALARKMLVALKGKKVYERVCTKDEVNYDRYSRPGKVVVLYA
jgi:hypothetical protein